MLQLERSAHSNGDAVALTMRPNRSISGGALLACFVSISAVALTVAIYFAAQGLWMPLPFAGLELAALGGSLWFVRTRDRRAERVEIDADAVSVMRHERRGDKRWQFASGWTRVRLAKGDHRWYPQRLLIGSHGNEIEVGAFLNEEERSTAAMELREALVPVSALRRI